MDVKENGATVRLAKAVSTSYYYGGIPQNTNTENLRAVNNLTLTDIPNLNTLAPPRTYREELRECRYFYKFDPTASAVINRMADMAVTKLRNRRMYCDDEEFFFYQGLAERLMPLLQVCALEYLISGMVIPDYGEGRVMGNRLHPKLGRKRYKVPDPLWVRNPEHITLKRLSASINRSVYLDIPPDEIHFITNEGKYPDGREDLARYQELVQNFPEYVSAVRRGVRAIQLKNARPVLRKPVTYYDYPQPFLVPALAALKHKTRIKQMDYTIATRAIEAIRHVKAGDKDFPLTEDDTSLEDIKSQLRAREYNGIAETIYTLFTNHTVSVEWVFPPLDALLNDAKYVEPNADIFLALGFPRVLLVGESNRSNAGQASTSIQGPVSTLNEFRTKILAWIKELYWEYADLNGFKNIPEPTFSPISLADVSSLVQYAIEAAKIGVLSKTAIAQMFGSDYETEAEQTRFELADGSPSAIPEPVAPTSPSTV